MTTAAHPTESLREVLLVLSFDGDPRVDQLAEKPAPGRHVLRDAVRVVEGIGFAGDHERKSYWRGRMITGREVSAVSAEVYDVFGVNATTGGDNLVTRGIDLRNLGAGGRVRIGADVVLQRSDQRHRPCDLFRRRTSSEIYTLALELDLRGALFIVVRGGTIRLGDRIEPVG